MNFAILSFIIGFILQFEALFLLLPWIVGMIYGEYHVALIYLVTAAVCFILGKLLSFKHTGRFKELYVREGFTAVALGLSCLFSVPFPSFSPVRFLFILTLSLRPSPASPLPVPVFCQMWRH